MVAGPGLKNSMGRHSVRRTSAGRAGGSHRADGSGLKFKAAGAMTNTARSGIFSSRHAGSRGNFVYASSSSKLAKFGFHINRNGKISNKPNFSGLRAALNGRSGGYSNNIRYVTPSYTTGNCSNCSGNSFMNTLAGIQQLMMMTQMFGEMFGLSSDKSEGNTKTTTTTTNTSSGIGNINSFTDISNAETELKSKCPTAADINSSLAAYKDVTQASSEVSETVLKENISDLTAQVFKDAKINYNDLACEELSGSSDLTKISKDITNVNNVIQNYTSALSGIDTAMNTYKGFMDKYEVSSNDDNTENKKIYDNAKKLYNQAANVKKSLTSGKEGAEAALADLQSAETQYKSLQDKKYKLAEDKDKELGKLVEKYNKLTKKGKTDEANTIKSQISPLYNELKGQSNIQNSKGETYNFDNLSKAESIVNDYVDSTVSNPTPSINNGTYLV